MSNEIGDEEKLVFEYKKYCIFIGPSYYSVSEKIISKGDKTNGDEFLKNTTFHSDASIQYAIEEIRQRLLKKGVQNCKSFDEIINKIEKITDKFIADLRIKSSDDKFKEELRKMG